MPLWVRVVGGVVGYFSFLYLVALASAIATTEARCLELRIPTYRVTYDFQRYCVVPVDPKQRSIVLGLEALEGMKEAAQVERTQ